MTLRLLCFVWLAGPLAAQVESLKTRFGDDLAWASPAYDDSGWTPEEDPAASRFWTRLRVRVPGGLHDPVIGLNGAVFEVYAEGRLIGRRGHLPPDFQDAPRAYVTFPLPSDLAQPGRLLLISVRRWDAPGVRPRGFAQPRDVKLHSAAETFYHRWHSNIQVRKRGAIATALIMAAALLLLIIASQARDRGREFWLAVLFCAAFLAWSLTLILVSTVAGVSALSIPNGLLITLTNVLGIELLAQLAGVRPGRWIRGIQIFTLVQRLSLIAGALWSDSPGWLRPVAEIYSWPSYALFGAALVILARRSRETPLASCLVMTAAYALGAIGTQGASVQGTMQVTLFEASIPLPTAGFLAFGLALCAALLYRFRQTGAAAAALAGQMAAARQVQQLLLLGQTPETPGYSITPVYLPADDVGGDFFRILAGPDGSTLIVTGDVSGKGLRAAMVVSVIVGVLLNRRSHRPAEVLAELNQAITGQLDGGFVTCLAVLLSAAGRVTAANAGHLPPYSDGAEAALPAGLPLGLFAGEEFAEAEFTLAPGGRLTLLSDGVVEATNPQGELFGFERTQTLSRQTAEALADAARRWGQNDDITVVTIERPFALK